MKMAPCAKLMIRETPKMSESPAATTNKQHAVGQAGHELSDHHDRVRKPIERRPELHFSSSEGVYGATHPYEPRRA